MEDAMGRRGKDAPSAHLRPGFIAPKARTRRAFSQGPPKILKDMAAHILKTPTGVITEKK